MAIFDFKEKVVNFRRLRGKIFVPRKKIFHKKF